MWNKVSLRGRLTLFTALIIVLICVGLTMISMMNAKRVLINHYGVVELPPGIQEDMRPIPGERIMPPVDIPRHEFNRTSILYMCLFLVIGTALAYVIAGRALKPLHNLNNRIGEIDENNLKLRVCAKNSGAEILRLTESFNHMLSRLESAFEGQRRFAQHAAHELKTPLSIMMTNIEVLQMDANPTYKEYEEVVAITKENTERLITIVSELLTLNATINAERIKAVDLHDLFERIFVALSASMLEKELSAQNHCRAVVQGDPELLYHAFFNLVENAVKYNVPGGTITITDDAGRVKIEDTGIGIPEKDLKNVFEPFYCVDPSRSRSCGGSGLGLSVVKAIVEKHGGLVWAQSGRDRGASVYVKLPNNTNSHKISPI